MPKHSVHLIPSSSTLLAVTVLAGFVWMIGLTEGLPTARGEENSTYQLAGHRRPENFSGEYGSGGQFSSGHRPGGAESGCAGSGCTGSCCRPACPTNCCPPTTGATAYGGSPRYSIGNHDQWLGRPYAPGLYWIGPISEMRAPCPQLFEYLPGYYQPAYGGSLPRWYVQAEYLALFRDSDRTIPFASLGPATDDGVPVVLSTAEFNADFQSGVRTVIGLQWNDHIRIEGSFFGSYSWGDLASVNDADGTLFSPFTDFGLIDDATVDNNTVAVIEYSSRLNNAEINLRHRLLLPPAPFEASALIGARYMSLDETFGYFTENIDGDTNTMDVATSNDLIGVQLGLLGQFLMTPWAWLDLEVKGAVAHNTARQSTVYVQDLATAVPTEFDGSREETTTSFIGETSLILNYQFRPSWTFRLGYQAIWLTGVALAEQNFETNLATLQNGPAQLSHQADVVFHGFNVGLVFAR